MKEKYKHFDQSSNKKYLSDFAFMVHCFGCMNELNTELIGKSTFAREVYLKQKG